MLILSSFLYFISFVSAGPVGIPFFQQPKQAVVSSVELVVGFGGKRSGGGWLSKRGGGSSAIGLGTADVAYFANLAIGTPPIEYLVLLDSGSSDLVMETAVQADSCSGCVTSGPLYNHNISSTAAVTNTPVVLQYGIGYNNGFVVSDVVTLGDFTASQSFAACYRNSQFGSLSKVTGILGLGWHPLAQTKSMPFVEQLWRSGQLAEPVFGMGFAQGIGNGNSQNFISGGYLTLGGTNSTLYEGDLTWIPITDNTTGYWPLPVEGVSVNGIDLGFCTNTAIIDSGTNSIRLPTPILHALYGNISGAQFDKTSSLYAFPCSEQIQLTFTIEGNDYPLLPGDFKGSIATTDGSLCYGEVLDGGPEGDYNWILGSIWMQSYYTAFRFSPPSLGFAPIAPSRALETNPIPFVGTDTPIVGTGVVGGQQGTKTTPGIEVPGAGGLTTMVSSASGTVGGSQSTSRSMSGGVGRGREIRMDVWLSVGVIWGFMIAWT